MDTPNQTTSRRSQVSRPVSGADIAAAEFMHRLMDDTKRLAIKHGEAAFLVLDASQTPRCKVAKALESTDTITAEIQLQGPDMAPVAIIHDEDLKWMLAIPLWQDVKEVTCPYCGEDDSDDRYDGEGCHTYTCSSCDKEYECGIMVTLHYQVRKLD